MFDDYDRPIVKDLGSLIGTQVKYGNDGEGWRRDFAWIVGGSKVPKRITPIVIYVNDKLSRLKFSAGTERTTETHTPGRGPIFLRKKLGEGGFGVVTHFWNVSTAEEYALKQPSKRALIEKEFDARSWKREASIMGRIDHEHIVRLLRAEEEPFPKLYLEYLPGGSLLDQEHMSTGECIQVLRQLLLALAYLHRLEPPIVHRDIKPENILVESRYAGNIVVKFGDFGISRERRESGNWKTICGTWRYAAPEILESRELRNSKERSRKYYTTAVDIWSLGVVMFRLLRGLPEYKPKYDLQGAKWGKMILTKLKHDLEERPSELLQFLSTKMLVMAPGARDPTTLPRVLNGEDLGV
uniref:Protein kinase domain-containing protein n=1 Tax=Bionectria ochroleuca TaxID=29856 RepID=A0A0B7KJ04_BIOOC